MPVDRRTQNAAVAMAEIERLGLHAVDIAPKNGGFHERVNENNRDIIVAASKISKQPRQVFGFSADNLKLSKDLAKRDVVFITANTQWFQGQGIVVDQLPITLEANRWLAADCITKGSHHLSSDEEIDTVAARDQSNYEKIRASEANYGRDMDGNHVDRPHRKVTI